MGSYTYVQAYVPENYPAASACLEYYSSFFDNTQGKWYLPSAAELGYVLPKLNIINQTINDLSYYNSNIKTFTDQAYWTSSESDDYNAWYISFYNKTISKYSKDSSYYVRPFLKVKI